MKQRIIQLLVGAFVLIFVLFITSFKLPFYIYQPGNASELDPFVEIDGGYDSEGDMHLVTVRGGQATPIYYLWAKVRPYYHIYDLEEIRPEGISQEEYNHIQLQSMNSSQDTAIAVAFDAAGKEYSYEYNGVYVLHVEEGMPAFNVLKVGDQILSVDGKAIERTEDISDYVTSKTEDDSVEVEFIRDGETRTEKVGLTTFPDSPETVGMGIGLVADREIVTSPEISINSGDIGGPSAGLMFSLEIFDQLTEKDYTKGYKICGTGTISEDGTVGPIGGIDQKVVASDNDGCDLFFAPNQNGEKDSDFQVASKTAKEIETDMKVIPVDTFTEAVTYLEALEPKS
ncbi:SepM family pheromone-processing serine protease [Salirhabdus sp. Marseille-P4669]|uniref:SepM family pheromone-processing serine protease n=1 Tax=Salirhabdus sp. Marseille-P4669 TaxID=2042310 RepID=UPI000C7B005E|nr:SepM family pheromone-processing serine protease [Salirhabdus sp. Marseille-P4669]